MNNRVFSSENVQFLEVKFSIYLNRRVYVMNLYLRFLFNKSFVLAMAVCKTAR